MSETFPVTADEVVRFYSQTKHEKSDGSGCLLWTGKVSTSGYGVFNYRGNRTMAHRFSLKVNLGRGIAPGKWSLHSCNVKLCVKHVREGTPSENQLQSYADGLSKAKRKVSVEQVAQMEWLINQGVPVRIVTKVYGVHRAYFAQARHTRKCRARA